jgi:hypothetical protein
MTRKPDTEHDPVFMGAPSWDCGHCGGSGVCTRRHGACGWRPETDMGGRSVRIRDGETCGECQGHGRLPGAP